MVHIRRTPVKEEVDESLESETGHKIWHNISEKFRALNISQRKAEQHGHMIWNNLKPSHQQIWIGCQAFSHTNIPCFIVLCFAEVMFCFVLFSKLTVCGNTVLSKSIGVIVLIAFAHFISLWLIWYFSHYKLFDFYCIYYGDLWSLIFDVTIVIFEGL